MPTHRCFRVQHQAGGLLVIQLNDSRQYERLMDQELRQELVSLVEQQRPEKLIVSFESVEHCPTSIINGLLSAMKRMNAQGGAMKLCSLPPRVHDVFKLLRLDGTVFDIYPSEAEARDAF